MQILTDIMGYFNPFHQCMAVQFDQEVETDEHDYFERNIPREIELYILESCPQTPSEASKLALVNRKWKKLFLSSTIWKRILENPLLPVAQPWFQKFKEKPNLAKECKQHLISRQKALLKLCLQIDSNDATNLNKLMEYKRLNTIQRINCLNTWLDSNNLNGQYEIDLSSQNLYEIPPQLYRMKIFKLD
ncbi:MAG: hypothetical protein K0S74_160 [Chlamydiales bacterium]|jgi:hypothetical protein|nr:hypothetical protein [Chlamydiales bacterium]